MRILESTTLTESPPGWREDVLREGKPVVVDVGTGDGRWPYDQARRNPATLYVGLDPDAQAMAEYAYRAGRKPSRGGVDNVLYVVAALEKLPEELEELASSVRVNFPWSGLLRAVLLPEHDALAGLKSLLAAEGRLEIVLTYDSQHDSAALAGEELQTIDEAYVDSVLVPAYAAAGLQVTERSRLSRDEALAIPSTWGRRLLHGRPRDVFMLKASPQ